MREDRSPGMIRYRRSRNAWPVSGDNADEQAFQPKWWNSSPLLGIVTVWTIWLNVGEPVFVSTTASASGFEKSGLSNNVYAKFSGGASIASFGDAWKVGSGLIVMKFSPVCFEGA